MHVLQWLLRLTLDVAFLAMGLNYKTDSILLKS